MRYFVLVVLVGVVSSALLVASRADDRPVQKKPTSEKKEPEKKEADKFEKFDLGKMDDTPPAELDVDPALEKPALPATDEDYSGNLDFLPAKPPVDGPVLSFPAGPIVSGSPGLGLGLGSGTAGVGFGSHAKMLATGGGNHQTERAVTAALIWLANHQSSDGSWSLQNYTQRCMDKSCTGQGTVSADAGATAMGLLPFLAAGQTHKSKGPYKDHISRALAWLIHNQQPDGNLAKGAHQMMYSHGLATIALCEDYGLSGDKSVGLAAQRALDFILRAQNPADGGWRYNPGDPGDTSVTGWQLTALKSAQRAGLNPGKSVFSGASKWFDSVAVHDGAQYSYQPGQGAANTMTAVGLLGRQYLGAKRDNPMLKNGTKYLMAHLPDEAFKNIYYWYYATQVMHNLGDSQWDQWNKKMRDLLVKTQCREDNCAKGSWDPANDAWGKNGGRVMQTALSVLTLEVYYRYLFVFQKADEKEDHTEKK